VKAIVFATIAIVVITVGSYMVLGQIGFSSADRSVGDAVRLDDEDRP
jgi:hypothetical protein